MLNKTRFTTHLDTLDHGHGGVVSHTTNEWIGGSVRAHAVALLGEVDDPDWNPTGEAMREALDALTHIVLALIDHTALPKE